MKKIFAILMTLAMVISLCTVSSFAAGSEIPYNSSWSVTESSHFGNHKATFCFDENPASFWHSSYTVVDGQVASKVECPHTITVDFGETLEISGWRYTPRTDNSNGTIKVYNIYASEDGETFKKIYEGAFEYAGPAKDFKPSEASWGNVSMRAIKIEATATISGYGTCAEIDFLTGTSGTKIENGEVYKGEETSKPEEKKEEVTSGEIGTLISKSSSWTITESSHFGNNKATLAFDGNPSSYWHTLYTVEDGKVASKTEGPHTITVDFGETLEVSGWRYTPRTDNASGTITTYNIYASADGTTFTKIYEGTFDYKAGPAADYKPSEASWGNTAMKAIKIETVTTISGYGTCAEINFFTGGSGKKIENGDAYKEQSGTTTNVETKPAEKKEEVKAEDAKTASNGTPTLDRTGWSATVNSEMGSCVNKIFDGKIDTYWHSHYTHEGATVTGHDNPPYFLEVTLPEAKYISGIILAPRKDNSNGRILTTDILVTDSDDGEFYCIYEDYEFENTGVEKEILFASNILVKKVKLEITVTAGGYGTLSEFYLLTENANFNKVAYDEFKANEDANRLYKLNASNMRAECDYLHWANNHVNNIFDGNSTSFWQTDHVPNGTIPPTLKIDLGEVQTFSRFDYTPRQSADCHGYWFKINIWGSVDGGNWDIIEEGIDLGEKSTDTYVHNFEVPATARYLEIEFVEFNAQRISCAELVFYQTKADRDASGAGLVEKYELKIGSNTIKVTKGEESYEKTIDVAPYIVNGSTLIPLRGLLEEMGAEIGWEAAKEKVHITKGNLKLTLQIWNKLVYADDPRYGEIRYTLLNYPVIKDSRTFIPVRFVSEQLGYNVAWDGETQTIIITSITE